MPHHKPYGLLQPLDIPDRPWKSILMDFIVKLPVSRSYDSIWVMCNHLTRAAHFIPCHETLEAPGRFSLTISFATMDCPTRLCRTGIQYSFRIFGKNSPLCSR